MKNLNLICIIVFILIYKVSHTQYSTILNFEGTNGSNPYGNSLFSDGNFLFGMTYSGGVNGYGTIFRIKPDGTDYEKLFDFEGETTGKGPYGTLIYDGTYLYGMTESGGINNMGTLFKISSNGTGYTKLLDFMGSTNGAYPFGSLFFDGIFLYGMTSSGGTNDYGTIFKIMTNGTNYSKLLDFEGITNGSNPTGSLIFDGTYLYGTTRFGGINSKGTIFKIKPDGSGFENVLNFSGLTNGRSPFGDLLYDGIFLYGMTNLGGTYDMGTIFKIMPDGNSFSKLLDFNGSINGNGPEGSLISDGTFFYGMTFLGGIDNKGTIFKILPNGTGYSKLLDFSGGLNGRNSRGSLLLDDNILYGMTEHGGTVDAGVLFKFNASAGIDESIKEDDIRIFPNPTYRYIDVALSANSSQTVLISNVLGDVVFKKEFNFIEGISISVDLCEEPAGIYLLRVGNSIKRIIKL